PVWQDRSEVCYDRSDADSRQQTRARQAPSNRGRADEERRAEAGKPRPIGPPAPGLVAGRAGAAIGPFSCWGRCHRDRPPGAVDGRGTGSGGDVRVRGGRAVFAGEVTRAERRVALGVGSPSRALAILESGDRGQVADLSGGSVGAWLAAARWSF